MRVDGREATCGLGEMRRARPRPPPRDTAEEMCTREGHAHGRATRTREGHAPALDTGRLWPGSPIGRLLLPWSRVTSSADSTVPGSGLTELPAGLRSDRQATGCWRSGGPAQGPALLGATTGARLRQQGARPASLFPT